MPITVSIVEDDPSLCKGLVRLLERTPDIRCQGCYANAEEALLELPKAPPEVVLMDIHLPGIDGIECVRKLKELDPSIRIVMLTVYENPERIFKALAAGAIGYVLKHRPADELVNAIRDAHFGGAPMSSHIARKVVQFFQANAPADEAGELSPVNGRCWSYCRTVFSSKKLRISLGWVSARCARTSEGSTKKCTFIPVRKP